MHIHEWDKSKFRELAGPIIDGYGGKAKYAKHLHQKTPSNLKVTRQLIYLWFNGGQISMSYFPYVIDDLDTDPRVFWKRVEVA